MSGKSHFAPIGIFNLVKHLHSGNVISPIHNVNTALFYCIVIFTVAVLPEGLWAGRTVGDSQTHTEWTNDMSVTSVPQAVRSPFPISFPQSNCGMEI